MDTSTQILRAAIVDDHKVFTEGLQLLLKSLKKFDIVDIYNSGEDFILGIEKSNPDVVFMDIAMKELNGFDATRYAIAYNSKIKVIALSMNDDSLSVHGMMEAGAAAYLTKSLSIHEIKLALEMVEKGELYITPNAALNYSKRPLKKEGVDTLDFARKKIISKFSDREIKVIRLICEGKKNSEIAKIFYISEKTVEWEKKKIMDIMGVRKSTQIVTMAYQLGIIQ